MEPQVMDRPEASRYEILAGDDGTEPAGFAEYFFPEEGAGNEIAFTHTEIDPRFGGQGLGGRLIRAALDDVRTRGLVVLPYCPFVGAWIGKHPPYLELVPEDRRAQFGL